jgi:uncharacterized membrane protein
VARKRKTVRRASTPAVSATAGATATPRLPLIDALRGGAIVMMIAYHFAFDLNYFGLLQQNFYRDPFWIAARNAIVGSFLLLVGISFALATAGGIDWRAWGRRLALIAACAATVSAGSYLMFPKSWIYFGVLHFIVVAGIAAPAFARLSTANLVLGVALFIFGVSFKSALFDQPWLHWIGLVTRKPVTEDYVPLLPWFGVVLVGLYAGRRIVAMSSSAAAWRWSPTAPVGRALTWAGQHSLAIYMLHQPLLLGLLYLLAGRR